MLDDWRLVWELRGLWVGGPACAKDFVDGLRVVEMSEEFGELGW